MMLKRFNLTLILFIFGLSCWAQTNCIDREDYTRCEMLFVSPSLGNSEVPLFFYFPRREMKDKKIEVYLFLHGRGYARSLGATDSMLENMDLAGLYQFMNQKNPEKIIIFVAPQDVFHHADGKIGQDYWMGADQRDWMTFLGKELPQSLSEKRFSFSHLATSFAGVVGISMGAHGALMLGDQYSQEYPVVIALSPILRATPDEFPLDDLDVFLPEANDLSSFNQKSFGTKVLNRKAHFAKRSFIEISQTDFGLDLNKYPHNQEIWETMMSNKANVNHHIAISADQRGHHHEYWIDALKNSLSWINSGKREILPSK